MYRLGKYTALFVTLLIVIFLAGTTLSAHGPGSMGRHMMGEGGMMGMMGQGMRGMMESCRSMMGGAPTRPNEQWNRPDTPDRSAPGRKG